MDYGEIVTTAWRTTWRYRGLWLLGFFAGNAGSSCISGGGGGFPDTGDTTDSFPPGNTSQVQDALDALATMAPLLLTIGVFVALIWLGLWLLSIACSAALIVGGAAGSVGRPTSIGPPGRRA